MDAVLFILRNKGSLIHSVPPTATVLEATRLMNDHHVGAVMVMDGDNPVGIFTERDVLTRIVAADLAPADVPVADVMTREVVCCSPDTDIKDASRIMRDRRLRHLPVCDGNDGKLLGIISIGDLNAYHASSQEAEIHFLHDYVFGRS